MLSVLRAGVLPVLVAALAAPAFASPPAGVPVPSACPDGLGGRWSVEVAGVREGTELRLVHLGADGAPAPAVTVHRVDGGRGVCAQLRCDGRGGAWLAWTEVDYVTTTTEVRAAHVGRGGVVLSGGGDALASFFDLFDSVSLLSDGRGGAYVAWREADANHERTVRVCRLAADGRAARGWPARGLAIDGATGNVRPRLVTDGEGGAIVVTDADPNRPGADVFALRVSPDAALLR